VSGGPVVKPFDPFSQDASALRKTLVAAALPAALFAAVIAQLTVVNRLPLPGGDAPDLVLLLVAAASVVTGNTMAGTVAGFAGGLALDVAPPVSHYAGEYALVFCLVGYLAARVMAAIRLAANGDQPDPSAGLTALAVAATAGEAGKAGLGLLLSDPNVTGPTVKHVLPGAVLLDLLLTPVVYWLVATVARQARPVAERAPAPVFPGARRLASVFRLASAGAAPDLRLAGAGAKYAGTRPARGEPKLRLADARSNSLARTDRAASNSARVPLAGGRAAKLNFAAGGSAAKLTVPHRRQGPATGWIRRSRAKDRWLSRRRSLSGALLSAVRGLFPTGDRR
jgi:rod shape-determining protein MreD